MAAVHAAAYRLDRPWTEAEFASLTDSPHVMAFGDARAILLVRIIADEAEVLTIATHPDQRRKGLARALLAQFHAAARARGATRAFLEVAADNDAALNLYLAAGYRRIGLRRAYYARAATPAADALVLERPLT
ncbi:MAG: GNAT family N-acetyltransferase [Paracoccaceae bacterium]|jgi:ribosomal-protein-alanine N-acetyltransferase|nr:GNAT family N-acetyltransferase [Paracoccaceae bacterium]